MTSWRRWAIGGAVVAAACGLAAGRYWHMVAGPPEVPTATPVSNTADAGSGSAPPPASASPSAIVAAFDKQKDPVDQVALLRKLPESPAPPPSVVEAAAELAKGPLPIAVLRGHTLDLSAARFAEGGKRVVTASYDGTVRVWPSDGSGESRTLDWGSAGERRVMSLAVAPGLAAASTEDGDACIWMTGDADTFSFALNHVDKRRSLVRLSADGNTFIRGFEYGQAHFWHVQRYDKSFAPEKTGVLFGVGALQDVELAADGSVIARAPDKITAFKVVKAQASPDQSLHAGADWNEKSDIIAALSPRGDAVVVAGSDGRVRFWHQGTGSFEKPASELKHEGAAITAVAIDGDRCAFGTADGGVFLWKRTAKGKDADPVSLGAHKGRVTTVAFGNAGKSLVTAGADGVARVFTLDGSSPPLALGTEGGAPLGGASMSDDGALVVTMVGRTAQVWRLVPTAPAAAGWKGTHKYLRTSSSVELSDDRMREILTPPSKPQQRR